MPLHPAAPTEARSLRPLAWAITHARIPAALKLLLLALLAALSAASRTRRHPRQDWYPSPELDAAEHPDSPWNSRALRKIRRQRAWIGYILRCAPAEGMSLSGQRAPVPRPPLTARAPPLAGPRPKSPRIRRKNLASRGDDSWLSPRGWRLR